MYIQSHLANVIKERRSIKNGYLDQEVPLELVEQLLEVAVWAPTHGLREPWRFIFVSSEQKETFVAQLVQTFPKEMQENRRNYFSQPAAFLIVVMQEDPRQKQWEEDFGAVSSLIQNFQLLAWEQKLGVVWKTNPHIYDPKVRDLVGVAPGEKIVGFLHLGYFDEVPKAMPRTSVKEKLTVYDGK
ncbi:nitroreductase [Halalkalibacterium halodurans]|uniref:Putative NAD(P)H nitroreductase n=2 Tax=Halalkalibacterium halodurans TaxID=86665 RepID=Q9KG12_HALH5|nr:nitroreductase [Halalkalibacterium halodurans]MED4081734.1 nitroreductase [Halalkalibacterium halodurans]MED4085497.1 nitroreductase [Halalkalibacterium halodurans]MED4106743.1 nitroreductase [Halalkalibacterium halodurans]MED4110064.1 nitroreductase [Halalkalibacterium halodurans]MED4125514.1 nitroreductase [Halalkalibacterium halodurans]